jgi:hypothetical protein
MNFNNNENMTFVKIAFKDELRRVAFAPETGFQGLQETCAKIFALKNFAPYQLTYKDAEGDLLILSSTEELDQLVADGKTPKLNLVARKVAKPVAIRVVRAPAPETPAVTETSKPEEEKVTPQAIETAPAVAAESATEEAPKEQEPKAPKKSFKEKRMVLKEQTVSTKVVRLRWRQANPDAKPQETTTTTEGESERGNWKQKKLASKGCYVGATFKGKIKFTCGVGKKGLWFCRELTNGDRMFSPLCAPFRFLRVYPDGTVNLSHAGIGQKTRWGFAPLTSESNFGGRLVSRATPNLHLTAVSAGKKKKCHSEKKKERVEARGLNLAAAPNNLLSSEFAIEEVDAVQVLKWMAIRKAWKKRAHHHAKKEQKKQAKHLAKCERRQAFLGEAHAHGHGHHPHDGAHPHPHAFPHAHGRHHWRHHKEHASPGVVQAIPVPLAEPQQQPEQVGAIPQQQQQAPGPHPRPCIRPGMMLRHHFRHPHHPHHLPHGPFNV